MSAKHNRILIVDDHQDICASMRDILDDVGYEVVVTGNANDALEQVDLTPFDVVLLDYQMPDMNGAALLRIIKQKQKAVTAFLITAYAGSTGAQDALNIGATAVLQKPINVVELLGYLADAERA
ncbi:response regulator [Stieleria marina]|uniref:response regulator n=1 Tax=Stieleria marina TaxID=1930275 RepID=UPI003AF38D88